MRTRLPAGPAATVCQALGKRQGSPGGLELCWGSPGSVSALLLTSTVTLTGHSAPLQMSISSLPGAGEDQSEGRVSPALTRHRVGAHRCAGHPDVLVTNPPSMPAATFAGRWPRRGQEQCLALVPEQAPPPHLPIWEDHQVTTSFCVFTPRTLTLEGSGGSGGTTISVKKACGF